MHFLFTLPPAPPSLQAEIALMSLHIDAALLRQQLGQLHEQLSSWRHGGISFDEFCLLYVELFCQELEGGHGSCNEHEWAVSLIFSHFLSLLYWAASEWILYMYMYIMEVT